MQSKKLSSEWLNELKAKNDIVTTISSYIPVVKKGRSYWARCPFHHEKTPSFAINNEEQYYHCFGCGEGGDVITFIEKIESISTGEAMRKLAEKTGLEMPIFEGGEAIAKKKKQKDEVLKALNLAKDFYVQNLYKPYAKIAQDYVKSRGFKKSDLDKFEIGYSNSNTVIKYLEENGVSQDTMLLAGIITKTSGGRAYDHLYNRLVFPIFNTFGECVGFSGRLLEKSSERAKYKNTAQTPVFDKGSLIYGIHLLKQAKRKGDLDAIILVEGQIDVIMMHSFGFNSAVASLGTAFTEKHAEQLKKIDENIILLFDSDSAGQKATLRTIDVLKPFGFNIKVARLPIDSDPDEYLKQNGAEGMKKLIAKAKVPVEYQLDLLRESSDISKPNEKARYVRQALDLVVKLETMSERDVYLKIIRDVSGIPIDILRRDANFKKSSQTQKKDANVLINRENGNIKAINYVMQSILRDESFSKLDFDIKNYIFNPVLKSILIKHESNDKKDANILDVLDENEKKLVNELFNSEYLPDKRYFDESVWKIIEEALLIQQEILNEKYKNSEDREERSAIAEKLRDIINQLKEKKIH